MNLLSKKEKLKKAYTAFAISLALCLFSLIVLIKAVEGSMETKLVTASLGFVGFLTLTVLVLWKILKLRKAVNQEIE